jgi:hypothetical protein
MEKPNPTGNSDEAAKRLAATGSVERGLGWLLIIVAGVLAFAGCLRADFYSDDFGFILNSNGDGPATRIFEIQGIGRYVAVEPGLDTMEVNIFQLVPTAFFLLTEILAPDVAEASWLYHLWNLLMHLGTACLAWPAGREVLRLTGILGDDTKRNLAALAGAILFACHPLCSEPVHYAKCLNSLTVAFFGMLAVWQWAVWLQQGGTRALGWVLGSLTAATFSYFPGMALTLGWMLLLGIFRLRSATPPGEAAGSFRWRSRRGAGVAALLVIGSGLLIYLYGRHLASQWEKWRQDYPDHWFTQGRVIWEYLRRVIIPVGLSSDHLVTWSRAWLDWRGVCGLVVLVAIMGACAASVLRQSHSESRGIALLVLLGLFPLVLRFAYVNAEVLVEYRAYPAVPWLMLLGTSGLVMVTKRQPALARVATALIAAIWILISLQRSAVWTDREEVARDVLQRYPLNTRAMTQLQAIANDRSHSAEVLRLHGEVLRSRQTMVDWNRDHPEQYYDFNRANESLVISCQWAVYAVADLQGSTEALKWADLAIDGLKAELPGHFDGDLTLQSGFSRPGAWPVLLARKTVAEHAREIDAKRMRR